MRLRVLSFLALLPLALAPAARAEDPLVTAVYTEGGNLAIRVVEQGQSTTIKRYGWEPTVSHDGRRILLNVQYPTAQGETYPAPGIYVTDIRGTQPQLVYQAPAVGCCMTDFQWAPGPDQIIGSARPTKNTAANIVEVSRSGYSWTTKTIIGWPGAQVDPAISPDGSKIVFVSSTKPNGESAGGTGTIWIANRDGSNPVQLTQPSQAGLPQNEPAGSTLLFYPRYLAFSPDGDEVSFISETKADREAGYEDNIYRLNVNTGTYTRVTSSVFIGPTFIEGQDWGADNRIVARQMHRFGSGPEDYFVEYVSMSPTGGEQENITSMTAQEETIFQDVSVPHAAKQEMTQADALAALTSHAPTMHYDDGEKYRVLAPEVITRIFGKKQKESNKLVRANGTVIAYPNPTWSNPPLSLEYLAPEGQNYANGAGLPVFATDFLSERDTHEKDAALYQNGGEGGGWTGVVPSRAVYQPTPYPEGDPLEPTDPHWWLQYWFFYYYNDPPSPTSTGDHEGDWEMIQIGLDKFGQPAISTYAQHGDSWADNCLWEDTEWQLGRLGGLSPSVFVADGTHASYFQSGSLMGPTLDNADGDGLVEGTIPRFITAGDMKWLSWPGKWGDSSNSPHGPAVQGSKWSSPAAFYYQAEGCPIGSAPLQSEATPGVPMVDAHIEGDGVTASYNLADGGETRTTAIQLSVLAGSKRVTPASRLVDVTSDGGTAHIPLPDGAGPYRLVVSAVSKQGAHSAERTLKLERSP
jgi:hypothetical protein